MLKIIFTKILLTGFLFGLNFSCLFGQGLQINPPEVNIKKFSGKVFDTRTKTPLAFAEVFIIDLSVGIITDENGIFVYNGSLPQHAKIKISSIGYEPLIYTVEKNTDEIIQIGLQEAHIELSEITVSSVTGSLQKHQITNIESKTIDELNSIPNINIGEAMTNIAGIYQKSTGVGISKPIIRGLSGMRVVTYLNGLRIENQQWGGDHDLGINETGIGSVEIIKGPSSLLYGADALGGVIYFHDQSYAKHNQLEGIWESSYESNTMRTNNTIGLKVSKKNLRANIYGNLYSGADYQLPNGLYLINSRFSGNNIKMNIGYNKEKWAMNIRYNYVYNYFGLPGNTDEQIVTPELFQSDEQLRKKTLPMQFNSNHYALLENTFYFKNSNLKLWLGDTYNNIQEYDEDSTVPGVNLKLNSSTYTIRWNRTVNKKTDLIIGSQGMYQLNRNDKKAEEILIYDANLTDNGVYAVIKSELKNTEVLSGVRLDNRIINTIQNSSEDILFSKNYMAVNYSVGLSKVIKKFKLRANLSSGYRPPHLSELLTDGFHHANLRYEIGNPELLSEKALQADVSAEFASDHISIAINPFYNSIQNYIYLNPTDSLINNFKVYAYEQAVYAKLYGGELGVHLHPHFAHTVHLESNLSYVNAKDNNANSLPLIPQTRINNVFRLELKRGNLISIENISIQHIYCFKQDNIAENETSAPAYQIINIGMNVKVNINAPVTIKCGVKNLLNTAYIDHLSGLKPIGLTAPGINFYIGLKVNFNYKLDKKQTH